MTEPTRFRVRILVLPVAAVLIYAAVEYGQQNSARSRPTSTSVSMMQAPLFEGADARKSVFRLQGWLGRHQILLVFFDGRSDAAADPVLRHLREHSADLQRTNTFVAAVSTALPSQNQSVDLPSTFALVTDLPPDCSIHRMWKCFDAGNGKPLQAVFLIDRAGNVAEDGGSPSPLTNVDTEIDRLLGTSHE